VNYLIVVIVEIQIMVVDVQVAGLVMLVKVVKMTIQKKILIPIVNTLIITSN
jgi:hypothetical protein